MKTLDDDARSRIKAEHLQRTAFIDVRPSSLHQVEHHQEGQRRLARPR